MTARCAKFCRSREPAGLLRCIEARLAHRRGGASGRVTGLPSARTKPHRDLRGAFAVTPGRYNRAVTDSTAFSFAAWAERHLRPSQPGRRTVHHTLCRMRLQPALADDLVQEVLRRACQYDRDGVAVDNPAALLARLIHRAAVDIVRGRARRKEQLVRQVGVDPHVEVRDEPLDGVSPLDVEADVVADDSLAALRRGVLCTARDPMEAAAALAYLAIAVDGAAPGPHCPQPDGGATNRESAEWAALWYAGRRRCFATDDDTAARPATLRQRRNRVVQRVRRLLRDVAFTIGLQRRGASHG